MKILSTTVFILLCLSNEIISQVVFGKLIDENSAGLAEVQLQLYTSTNIYDAISDSDGTFSFNIITGVDEDKLPTGYSVSNNFPNPFNPRTRLAVTMPTRGNVRAEVFNLLGQTVMDVIEQTFNAGTNYIDVELNGLPNGFYILRITIDDKYTIVKKMMLIYGSQHLITSGGLINPQLNKSSNSYFDTNLDSVVASSTIIGKKTFTDLPSFVSGTLDLGNLIIERYCPDCPTVLYEGKIYHTIQIGSQCWVKENLNIGTMIYGNQDQANNGIIEKYCYDNDTNNCNVYGGLYQWDETMQYVTTQGTRGICPIGWHIPTLAEIQTLIAIVNNDGNLLRAIGDGVGSEQGTNTSGFSALLAGFRGLDGYFYSLRGYTCFWSTTEYDAGGASGLCLYSNYSNIFTYGGGKAGGFSVRCIKD